MIPRQSSDDPDPVPQASQGSCDRDEKNALDEIAAENFEIELSGSFERDVSEDAGVGAYIALVHGERLEHARRLGRSVRENLLSHPPMGLAVEKEDHEIAGLAVSILGIGRGNFTTFSILARDLKRAK